MVEVTLLGTNFARTEKQVSRRIDGEEWLGMQCFVALRGQTVLELAAGESAPGIAMTTDDPLRWTCSSKVVTASLFARLADAGLIDLHAPIPGYAERVTAARLLNHSVGLGERAEEPFLAPYERVAERARNEPHHPGFPVGQQRRYSSFANFAVLATLAERATGRAFTELVNREVFARCGALDSGFTGEPAPTWIGDSGSVRPALGELIPAESLGAVFPGVGCSGPARELAAVVRGMSPHAEDRPRSAPEFVTATAPFVPCQRSGDTAEWGLGFVVGWSRFGRCASPDSFGHAGCRSSLVMHDPRHDLSIAVIGNTISESLVRSERVKPFIPAIYDDLGL
ncbi:serine hydrolase domain-containing protein [Sciscionella sediminilitoris]|uniref:serine hydrolase domain-containing protein n=1 Tax=Sciscionella sediminilitoris TaxID=1445613 RepID=UPI0004DF7E47|nr:serine hydrolase domain-containing protein [Sciscionella sp. SE31]